MGSSYTDFRGRGFWARDGCIEGWLYLLAREEKQMGDAPEWLRAASDDWHLQATAGLNGCISARLDDHVATDEQATQLIAVCERVLAWLETQAPAIPAATLNGFGTGGPGSHFAADVSADAFAVVGKAFVKLLQGDLATEEGPPRVL